MLLPSRKPSKLFGDALSVENLFYSIVSSKKKKKKVSVTFIKSYYNYVHLCATYFFFGWGVKNKK